VAVRDALYGELTIPPGTVRVSTCGGAEAIDWLDPPHSIRLTRSATAAIRAPADGAENHLDKEVAACDKNRMGSRSSPIPSI